ncbi:C39 family peptidase [Novosphingobium sp. PS1R-30]|uniref:C39 family peptidase n=1 Tax=Novosphingobium anseongense TaxID=3133436 RepID=A0ABU8RUR7_9SPHN
MRGLLLVALAGALAGCATGPRDQVRFFVSAAPVGDYSVALRSVEDMRFTGIVRQRFDFSCGSAALATLLRYHYNFNVREDNAFRGMWARGDQAQIRRLGFSLLDMKSWLASRGLQADGYKVSLEDVEKTGLPGIALISIKNYRHFVVVKGIRGDEVLVGDPSSGLTAMPRKEFLTVWNGVYFILNDEQLQAKTRFNRNGEWVSFARAPVGRPFSEPLSLQALSLTAPFYGDIS